MVTKYPDWIVLNAQPHKDYNITLKFRDGTTRLYDAKPLLDDPMYVDIAPEHLHEANKIVNYA